MNQLLNFEQCSEIFQHNMDHIQYISFSKTHDNCILVSINFEKKNDDFEIKKYFRGPSIQILKEEINKFMNDEIKL